MRYEDWDVLLFNGQHTESGHIPLKEFKTQCYALEDASLATSDLTGAHCIAPLITCFTPSIDEGLPFQVSVHSWTPKPFFYSSLEGTQAGAPTQLWQVKIMVDGFDACIEHYPENVHWPKVIPAANLFPTDTEGNMQPLRFPKFYKSVMSQHHWDANDFKGRIKVEISEGYVKLEQGKQVFVKLMNHATFNFQPAPLDVLQRAAIAWPNTAIFKNPIKSDGGLVFGQGPAFASRATHQRNMSASSMNSMQSSPSYFGGPLPPSSFNYAPGLVPPNTYANSSRSSSAYSTIPVSSLPLPVAVAAAAARSPACPSNSTLQDHVQLRIPSDQLEKILSAIGTPKAVDHSMPPPPLPQHVIAAAQATGNEAAGAVDRRLANGSDISMHPDCESYPVCTSEDTEGRVVHNPPAQGVRSRKEGTIDNHNRDFFSNVLNPASADPLASVTHPSSSSPVKNDSVTSSSPAHSSGRKRTRSETKTTSVNEGSPEKVDKDTSKPARKVSRASAQAEKENVQPDEESMVLDP
ncbi:hypothetical protein M409DRAFT_19716 [Zasmidium cellare ATCC 36951]|uniref:Uncharacterized protein n=1 Tax=Zasmidium cellare ATCC 36951 TaxID=1080233 RepID=A0A6A6CV84_ZASCE|nr:uncharacterized protein M409DRAFT_19716 [Zasmidium cellare ATCC 36951]KAF2170110.1 hypothetical protein M409DRAFT_19716 [Zasmidium cellare ATCC 36951]